MALSDLMVLPLFFCRCSEYCTNIFVIIIKNTGVKIKTTYFKKISAVLIVISLGMISASEKSYRDGYNQGHKEGKQKAEEQ